MFYEILQLGAKCCFRSMRARQDKDEPAPVMQQSSESISDKALPTSLRPEEDYAILQLNTSKIAVSACSISL